MEFVNVTDLKKNYGDLEAVKGVSFGIEEGEVFGLLGPNGAGKTSIINMLIGLSKPSFGKTFSGKLHPFIFR
jgi:ABC-2 type transport system ATP-binding protein